MVGSGLVTESPCVAVKPDSGEAVFAAEASGVRGNHLVCRAGLPGDYLMLHAVDVVLMGLLWFRSAQQRSRSPENKQGFPMTAY
jgi:hypothetical protein